MNEDQPHAAALQLYRKLHKVVSRYSKESDVTVFETVGALEAVKLDMMDELKRWNEFSDENT